MNKSEIIAEDWILESSLEPKGIWDYAQNRYYADLKETSKHIRVVGTQEQIDKERQKDIYLIDEVYMFQVEPKDSYWYKIYDDPEQTNQQIEIKLREYRLLYKLNKQKLLIINIK